MKGSDFVFPTDIYSDEVRFDQRPGLTKREYFAAKAMQAMLSNAATDEEFSVHVCARGAVEIADALIDALNAPF